jgi:hypothetical protein
MDNQFGKTTHFLWAGSPPSSSPAFSPGKPGKFFYSKASWFFSDFWGDLPDLGNERAFVRHTPNPEIFHFAGCIMKIGKALDPVLTIGDLALCCCLEIPVYLAVDGISFFNC